MVKDSSFTIISYIHYNRKEGNYMDTKRWKVMLAADDYGSFTREAKSWATHSPALPR